MVTIPEAFANDILNYFMSRPFAEVEIAVQNLRHFIKESTENAQASLPFPTEQQLVHTESVLRDGEGPD